MALISKLLRQISNALGNKAVFHRFRRVWMDARAPGVKAPVRFSRSSNVSFASRTPPATCVVLEKTAPVQSNHGIRTGPTAVAFPHLQLIWIKAFLTSHPDITAHPRLAASTH